MTKHKKEYKRFISNTIMQYIMTLAKYVFPLITFPYLTRVLDTEMYGVITYMTATISYLQLIVDFGFDLSATKKIAENQGNKKFIGEILGTVIEAKLLLAIVSLAVLILVTPFIPILRDNILILSLYYINVVLTIFLPDFLFRGLECMEIITIRFIISKSITTLLTFVFIHSENDILWLPILNVIGTLVAIVWNWSQISNKLGIRMFFGGKVSVFARIKESTIYFVSTFATTAFAVMNTFMFGVMSINPIQIAYWGISINLISSAQQLYSPIINSLYPHMVIRKDFYLVKKLLIIFMIPIVSITAIVYINSDLVIYIFSGSEYSDANPIFRALLPVLVFSFPAQLIGFPVLGAIDKVRETTITTVISAIFQIIGLVFLIVIGKFTVFNVAVLRSITEFILLMTRFCILFTSRKEWSK